VKSPLVPAYVADLARLEAYKVRAFWRFASRDLMFDVAVLVGCWIIGAAIRSLFVMALHGTPPMRLLLAGVSGPLLYLIAYSGAGARARERLRAGPFQLLVSAPGRMMRWMALRAYGYFLALGLALAAILASLDPVAAPIFLAVVSLTGAAVAVAAAFRPEPRPAPLRTPAATATPRLALRYPVAILAAWTLRRGRVPAWVIAVGLTVLAGAASRLAVENNHAPAIGYAIGAIAAVAAGMSVFPGGAVPGLLGRQPLRLLTLYLWLYAAPLTTGLLAGVGAGLIGGLGPLIGLQVGVTAATGLVILSWFAFLHQLIRSQRQARLATTLEMAGAAFMASIELSLAPLWLLARGALLVRSARRRRWLDR
jgi:hypothetical protein